MTRSNIVQGDKSRLHLIEALGVIKHVQGPSLFNGKVSAQMFLLTYDFFPNNQT